MARRVGRWAGWAAGAIVAVVLLFAAVNLAATAVYLAGEHESGRWGGDARRLALSGAPARGRDAEARVRRLYGRSLGPAPDEAAIRRHLERQASRGGPMVLDQALTDYVLSRWGRIDGRTVPPGVYVGARAIGPDTPPLSPVTKYLAQYALFSRHGYVLVVGAPEDGGQPLEFSASRASDFVAKPPHPHQLMIHPEPFQPGAYDFPSRGQAVHELFRLSDDPEVVRSTGPELRRLAEALRATDARYELFRQNSNTVLGCMLRASDLHRDSFEHLRRDPLFRLRLIAIGRPLWSQPMQRAADTRCR